MNDHIIEYLKYYINLKESPNYAILLDGEWGSGKTYMINKFIESENDHKFIRISLYGVTSISDIENSFFISLHPVLGSKPARVASKILKGILKTAIKVDLDNNDKDDITIDYKIPEGSKWLTNLDKHIIVIDDLERSTIPINVVLGYINELVESSGQKIIFIANEKEISKKEVNENKSSGSDYFQIKEKIVGKTFSLKSDFASAFESFVNKMENIDAKSMIEDNRSFITTLFLEANYNNLRILKQTIIDFDRFTTFLPEIPENKHELKEHIILLFFSLSFEVRKGMISSDSISKLFLNYSLPKFITKYTGYNQKKKHPISGIILENYFIHGTTDSEALKKEIYDSPYFYDEKTPPWKKLEFVFLLSDEEYKNLVESVFKKLKTKNITDKWELFEVVSTFIKLYYLEVVTIKPSDIYQLGVKNFKTMLKRGFITFSNNDGYPVSDKELTNFTEGPMKEIEEFINYVKQERKKYEEKEIINKNAELLSSLNASWNSFNLGLRNSSIPILKMVKVKDFYYQFLKWDNQDKSKLSSTLKERYNLKNNRNLLKDEVIWLESLKNLLQKRNNKGSVSGLIFKELIRHIEIILEDFKKDEFGENTI